MHVTAQSFPADRMNDAARQRGFSLVIVLIFTLVLIMLGITGMQSAGLQERMAGHNRDRTAAFQAAESALRAGESRVRLVSPYDFGDTTCPTGLCPLGSAPDPFSYGWADAKSVAIDRSVASAQLNAQLAADPRYFLEQTGSVPRSGTKDAPAYRITARAVGLNSQTSVRLQSVYVP